MQKLRKNALLESLSHTSPHFYYLLAMGGIEFLYIVAGIFAYLYLDHYSIIPVMLFSGTVIMQKKSQADKRQLYLGLFLVLWFTLLQTLRTWESQYSYPPGLFAASYLLAFPFAALTRDGETQKGLNWVAAIYIAASMVFVGFTFLLLIDHVPYFLESSVYWDGARLRVMWHPNICASIFMIGIGLCLGFFFRVRKSWMKCLLLAAAAVQFLASALTNSRTSVLMTCALIGGIVFFCIYRGGWKRTIAGFLAACTVIVALFLCANSLYKAHNARMVEEFTTQQTVQESTAYTTETASGEVMLQGRNNQRPFLEDLLTFNGRTVIWKNSLRAIKYDPSILIFGTSHTGNAVSNFNPFAVGHAHNSWLEILLGLGLPGFLAALVYTWVTLRSAVIILFAAHKDMWKKSIALLVVCLMAAAMMEPYLFYSDRYYPFFDFLFFLCAGYLVQWSKPENA